MTPEVSDLGYAPVWATDLGLSSRQRVDHATVLGDLLMLTETPTPRLTAVELDTGEIRWRRKLGEGVFPLSMPVRRDEDIIVVQDATRVAILDANDAELQAYQNLQNTLSSDPVLAGHELIYGSLNGVATAHDLELGFPKWRYALPYQIVARPAIRENRVVVVDEGGTYAMLNAEDGTLIWRGRAFDGITASPVLTSTAVFLPSRDGTLYALDSLSGEDLWVHHTTTPLTEPVASFGQNIYLPVPGRALLAMDELTGEVLWEAPASYRPIRLRDGKLLVYDGQSLHTLDPEDGRRVRTAPVREGVRVVQAPDDNLLLVGDNGRLLRLDGLE